MATQSEALNAELRSLYGRLRADIESCVPVGKDLSHPHLVAANDQYVVAKTRFMAVGQQTAGWGQEQCELGPWTGTLRVDDLMALYRSFNNSEARPDLQTRGMWATCYRFQAEMNPGLDRYGFLWSNLVKVDQLQGVDASGKEKRGKPAGWIAQRISELVLVRHEIEIASPDVVVFFTGTTDYYDLPLRRTFSSLRLEPVRGVPENHLVRLEHPSLPARSYRTHHPRILDSSGWKSQVIRAVCHS